MFTRMGLLAVLVFGFFTAQGQDPGFAIGLISAEQLRATGYARDTSANAVVLREFGEAYMRPESDRNERRLIFKNHYLIKILKAEGLNEGNIAIPLLKNNGKAQKIESLRAFSHNLVNNKIESTEANNKSVFTENINQNWEMKKLTIPNVRVGSIIEVVYEIEDPFYFYNFKTWEFQSHLPKVSSEYWATIPGNYLYNITWRGFLNFTVNESEILSDCFMPGAYKSDCARYKFRMENIPAFKEEGYMTAKSNFLAAVYFELSEYRYFDGRVDKITKAWKDADIEIRNDAKIGGQLKKGKDLLSSIQPELNTLTDPLEKARRIYSFINSSFVWSGRRGSRSEDGIKKAFDKKAGNIADINLSLIAAMRAAGLDVDLVLLSTRDNGVPTDLHPVITDFNYIIAKVNIGDKIFLADASDPSLPFGMLPFRCLNGKARVFPEKGPSYWHDIVPNEKSKEVTLMNLTLQPDGRITGSVENGYYGYRAYDKRMHLSSFNSQDEYLADLKKDMKFVTVNSFELSGTDIYAPRFVHKFDVEIDILDQLADGFILNPFFSDRMSKNPFKLSERLYPVNFGVSQEHTIVLTLTYPDDFILVEKPERTALSLPAGGGKFVLDIADTGNKATMTYSLTLSRPIYSSSEYHYLKELFNRVVYVQNFDWLFKKR